MYTDSNFPKCLDKVSSEFFVLKQRRNLNKSSPEMGGFEYNWKISFRNKWPLYAIFYLQWRNIFKIHDLT
jgi:hypothetical protein